MIQVIQKGINPILNQSDYPELNVRIGIDFGEIGVVQYGIDIDRLDGKAILTRPHIDMIGPTISMSVKMTSIAKTRSNSHWAKASMIYWKTHKRKLSTEISSLSPSPTGKRPNQHLMELKAE
jgi:hypothetical protein